MQITQALFRAMQTRPQHVATIYGERQRRWAEVGDRVARLAAALRSLGIAPGDRVAVLAMNSDRYIELFFAVAWAGAVLIPLNTRWAIPENVYALNDAECTSLIVDDPFLAQVAALQAQSAVRRLIYIGDGDTPGGMANYERLLADAQPMPDQCGCDDDMCGIYYTGGTTGFPKGVMLSNKNFLSASVSWVATLPFSEDTIYLHSAGFFHLTGAVPVVALTLAGGTHVCLPKFDVEMALRAIPQHRVNYCLLIPTMLNTLVNHTDLAKYDLSSVRTCQYGGSLISEALLAKAMRLLPTWQFTQTYGMTETAAVTLATPWQYHFASAENGSKREAVGRAVYGNDVRIVDAEGKELPRRQAGEIAIRGPQVMLGYWRKPEATAEALRNGWMFTGDLGWMDEEGFVYLVDRAKDMIKSGGENVYSREVENAIYKHPAVSECAVIGIPDEHWGEAVHAVLVLKAGQQATPEEIVAHCRPLIAGYKCPRSVEVRAAMPISAAGKIMKGALREPYWQGRRKPGS